MGMKKVPPTQGVSKNYEKKSCGTNVIWFNVQ